MGWCVKSRRALQAKNIWFLPRIEESPLSIFLDERHPNPTAVLGIGKIKEGKSPIIRYRKGLGRTDAKDNWPSPRGTREIFGRHLSLSFTSLPSYVSCLEWYEDPDVSGTWPMQSRDGLEGKGLIVWGDRGFHLEWDFHYRLSPNSGSLGNLPPSTPEGRG